MTRALVLGGGGPVGVAWELGVLAGLADAGLDLAAADRIAGTSAGAIVGAQIAAGRSAAEIHAAHLDSRHRAGVDDEVREVAVPDLGALMALFMRRPMGEVSSPALLREFGALALGAATMSEEAFVAGIRRLLLTGTDWPTGFACTAVEAETGVFRVWDARAGVDLARAVASSCAVPGLYPPVTIDGRRYIDGGVRSATNADVVAGADAVLMLAVTVRPVDPFMIASAKAEMATLDSGGTRTGLIVPDAACLSAFGGNLMDWSRHEAVAAAGVEQGQREAGHLTFWPSRIV